MRLCIRTLLLLALTPAAAVASDGIEPRVFPEPGRTEWRPRGCRSVPFSHPVLPPRTAFRRAHGDLESSDEVDLAYPPVFAREWIAEPSLYQVTTPAFDRAGNLYMTPLLPHEPILMISLEPETGARRFVVPLRPGQRGGSVVPVVLRDPEQDGEVIYVHAYESVVAVRSDGSLVWEMPTGLGPATTPQQSPIGLAWVPQADAIVGLTRDGFVFLLDRASGVPLLPAPYPLPGEATPPRGLDAPAALVAQVDALLRPLVALSATGVTTLIEVLLGGSSEVANNLSVDPRTGRLWIAASARDGEDGREDGVSELGAVYRFDVVREGDGWGLAEICHRSFSGGSASTPSLGQNGRRVYLGDDAGALIAIDAEDCGDAWSVPLDSQIFGSVAVASDGRELYAASAAGIFQVIDEGSRGRRGWTATLDLYEVPRNLGYREMNLLLTGIGANGLLLQAGVGLATGGRSLPVRTGIVHLDRGSGAPRWFADGLEESLGAMSTGPDGALYLPHAPLRRAFTLALGLSDEPLVGGISKWSATRHDLLARDAACAAADRAANAIRQLDACPPSALADLAQIEALRAQMRRAVERASESGSVDREEGLRLERLDDRIGPAPALAFALATTRGPSLLRPRRQLGRARGELERYHQAVARQLGRACKRLSALPELTHAARQSLPFTAARARAKAAGS